MPQSTRQDLRNVAIVAHVDHGKTTLVDAMLLQAGAFSAHQAEGVAERAMDSGELEREKGITILAKNTAVHYAGPAAEGKPMTINIIDTPGHADFGGEVERGLSMVDGIVLLVDASEGPLPQTRFVLRKALNADMPVILVVNKTDRSDARIAEVVDETYELFLDLLDESHSQDAIDFPVVYASGKAGVASLTQPENGTLPQDSTDLEPLFRTILETIPAPTYTEGAPLQAHVTNLDASPFLGRLALVRVHEGTLKKGQNVAWIRRDGTTNNVKITELLVTEGLERKPGESAGPGDIVAVAGIITATIVGFLVGIGRLSKNWLIRKLATVYIEIFRNIPPLLVILFWYQGVLALLPNVRDSYSLPFGSYLNNRGFYFPRFVWGEGSWLVLAGLVLGVALSWYVARRARARQMATGQQFPVFWTSVALIVGLPLLAFMLTGFPLSFDLPKKGTFNLTGGLNVKPEFLSLYLALSFYTASFIAEIVRAGIIGVPRGQTEAYSALGLRSGLGLRLVIIPQAMRIIIPPLTSQYLNLTKNSSLAVAIGYPDLYAIGGTILNQTGQAIEVVVVFMVVYLGISVLTSLLMNWFNTKMALKER